MERKRGGEEVASEVHRAARGAKTLTKCQNMNNIKYHIIIIIIRRKRMWEKRGSGDEGNERNKATDDASTPLQKLTADQNRFN